MKKAIIKVNQASKETLDFLMKIGIIYRGDDNEFHVVSNGKEKKVNE